MGIEAALLGAAATAATGTTAATAATAGLIGAGGSLTLGGIATGLGLLSSGMSLLGGMQQSGVAKQQASLAMMQADMAGKEQARQAAREAGFAQERMLDTERRQKLAFLSSGVTLEGSPLLVMEETRRKGLDNIDEILKGGAAAQSTARLEGRIQADNLRASGRQAFSSGITTAGQTLSAIGR